MPALIRYININNALLIFFIDQKYCKRKSQLCLKQEDINQN